MDLLNFLPPLLEGAWITIQLTVLSLILGLILGLFLVLGNMSKIKFFKIITSIYISAFRGTPLLVQLMIIYFALPDIGLMFTAFQAALIGLALNEAAYVSEIYRSGIQAVPKGQTEAAKSIGMSNSKLFIRIIFPQAFKICLPNIGNSAIILLKNTSLAAVITVGELMHRGELLAGATFRNMEIFLMVAVIYWILHYPLTLLVKYFEKKGDYSSAQNA
ncbi:amino acid ABC transporter permease [Salinicoccus kekensis]|uniref:Amino acid ABC transporter membrane protein (PAAT family) n=1 Tax=Salinicoccus kekensis TaxID=714307 RepID=A0A285UPA4_9STAP|nr:amino acid ABC transporter permease [Salinicoccus kekensis]SOC43700.1 amino acid ABC transporter membrane protein (PAAT family) [Salinicoccus kekensis]